jgi:hypothetical protein
LLVLVFGKQLLPTLTQQRILLWLVVLVGQAQTEVEVELAAY